MSNFFKDCNIRIRALCNMTGSCCCIVFSPLIRCCTNWCRSIPCPKTRFSNLNTNIQKPSNNNNSNSDSLYRTFNDDMMDLL